MGRRVQLNTPLPAAADGAMAEAVRPAGQMKVRATLEAAAAAASRTTLKETTSLRAPKTLICAPSQPPLTTEPREARRSSRVTLSSPVLVHTAVMVAAPAGAAYSKSPRSRIRLVTVN